MTRGVVAGLALALACAAPPQAPEAPTAQPPEPPAPAMAELAVSVVRGASAALPAGPQPQYAIVDLGSSLSGRPSPRSAVRSAADRTLRAGATPPVVQVLGQGRSGCVPPVEVPATTGGEAARALREMRGGARGSLADAFATIASRPAGEQLGASVVVWSDFASTCPGDPCAAAARLVEGGATLELVAFGSADVPACLEALASQSPSAATLAAVAPSPVALAAGFRVERENPAGPEALGRGQADGRALEVAPGPARVVVDLDPPMRIGPIDLPAGQLTRIRILDFPGVEVRQFFVDRPAGSTGSEGPNPGS